jgi:hypothetical protein
MRSRCRHQRLRSDKLPPPPTTPSSHVLLRVKLTIYMVLFADQWTPTEKCRVGEAAHSGGRNRTKDGKVQLLLIFSEHLLLNFFTYVSNANCSVYFPFRACYNWFYGLTSRVFFFEAEGSGEDLFTIFGEDAVCPIDSFKEHSVCSTCV